MTYKTKKFNSKQLAFQEIFVGTLIYIMVLGFFSDYTEIVYVKSFSTVFFASIVLEILTYLAFQTKGLVIAWLKDRTGSLYRIVMFFCVWLVMFLSKFIFIWTLDFLFGDYINIKGFFGILLVVLCVTLIHKLAYRIFIRLG